jgi:DNA-binding GntR family transcriptional regulator
MSDLSEQVYQKLKAELIAEVFPQDELIIEQILVERYGVSRTPVREAAMRLVHEGYLKKHPKKGYTIRCVSKEELQELRECRYILESGVIDILIAQATDEEICGLLSYVEKRKEYEGALVYWSHKFHLNMAILTGNENLVALLNTVLYKVARPVALAQRANINHYRELAKDESYVDAEHLALVDALLARDAKRAKEILKKDTGYPSSF